MVKWRRWARASRSRSWRTRSRHWGAKALHSFYTGSIAKQLVARVHEMGGIWTLEDFAAYKALEREPIVGHYRGATIISAPPPSSGGIALVEALNILSGYDLDKVDAVTRKHLIIEAMQRMHRDRAVYLGDTDFVKVPVARLTDPDYAAGLRTSIRLDKATPSSSLESAPKRQPAAPTPRISRSSMPRAIASPAPSR